MRALRAAPNDHDRATLRAFAREWPGALKELDTLTTAQIDERVAACASGRHEPWMEWMARYHELMRAALAIRRREPVDVDEEFARALAKPAHGRINVVVFAQLAREFEREPREIWDALFPRRGRAARSYRD